MNKWIVFRYQKLWVTISSFTCVCLLFNWHFWYGHLCMKPSNTMWCAGWVALESERYSKWPLLMSWTHPLSLSSRLHVSPLPPRAEWCRAATASAVIPRGETLNTRSCEKGPAPRRKWTRRLTALINPPPTNLSPSFFCYSDNHWYITV